VVDGKTVESKPMKVVMDPAVQLADAQRKRYNDLVTDLHDVQRRGTETAITLNELYPQMTDVAGRIKDAANVPADMKSQFESLRQQFDSVRVKFGVPLGAAAPGGRGGGGGGGGGGRGGAADTQNALARLGAVKGQLLSIWEVPSEAMTRQSADAKAVLAKAMTDATAVLAKAATVSQGLKAYNLTLTVPPATK
jgi:hypothetical protein